MLEIARSNFLKASNYLIDNYPQDKKAIVHVVEGYDTIETPEGFGFGVFVPEKLEIFIAGDMPGGEESLIKTLAHEYKHFMQYCEGKPFNEEEAEEFAEEIYKKITQEVKEVQFVDRYNRPINKADPPSIVYVKAGIEICIHHYAGCGREWFLNVREIGIDNQDLNTEDFETAVKTAQEVAKKKLSKIQKCIESFTS